jgi:hypothetical protein
MRILLCTLALLAATSAANADPYGQPYEPAGDVRCPKDADIKPTMCDLGPDGGGSGGSGNE